jgi:Methyltransferase domain
VTGDREGLSREEFARAVRESTDSAHLSSDHHPDGGYTAAAFRHYIREIALLDALQSVDFATALDVGCAEGYFMRAIGDHFGAEVWGVDLSMTALAKAHDKRGLIVAAADATRLPFADGSFDVVYSTEVIEHVLDPDVMIAELRRVARGLVLVTTPVSQTADEHEPDYALRAEGHVNNFDPATVRRLFGPDAQLGSFRCNATLALIVGVGRHMPAGVRDAFYGLDRRVSRRWGSPNHWAKPLRNRDWLISLAGAGPGAGGCESPGAGEGGGDGRPQWRCPACRGELARDAQTLRCASCAVVYEVEGSVPDFFKAATAR